MTIREEQDLVDVLEGSPVGTVILSSDGVVLFWNTSLLEILGGLQGEAFAEAASQGFFYVQREFVEACAALDQGGIVRGHEVRVARADGLEGWVAVSMRAITFEHQTAMLVWYIDVTKSRIREQALERTQETLLEVLDASPVGAAISDEPGRVVFWNNALIDQLSDHDESDMSQVIREAVALAEAKVQELGAGRPFLISRRDGTEKWITAWQGPISFEGSAANLVWIHNVTDLRMAELEAERATRAKSSFLATMSHEIRTPMNGVRTIAELLFGTPLNDEQRQMVNTIKDSADALVAIINEILDFSKIEAGRLEISPHSFELAGVVTGVVQLLHPKAEEEGLSLILQSDMDLESWHFGDSMRLRQILLNLIGNAIKFTAAGSVTLSVVPDERGIRFNVTDTGAGIPAERVKDLFAPFKQADASIARTYGGTGLGLSICKELAGMMGGAIGVETVVGEGSTFWLSLPLPLVDPPAVDVFAPEGPDPHRMRWTAPDRQTAEQHCAVVLCAEDNKTNRDVLSHVLGRLGIVFDMADNGIEALDRLDRSIHGLLLTDGHMPKMDGWSLSRYIRSSEAEQGLPRLPIVALTADAIAGIAERCKAAGMDGLLTKPLGVGLTEAMLGHWMPSLLSLRRPEATQEQLAADAAGSPAPVPGPTAIDLSMLIDLVGPEFEVLDPMLQSFLDSAVSLRGEISQALEVGNAQALTRAAHSLTSASRYIGAQELSDTAFSIEKAAAEGQLAGVPALAEPLDHLMEEVVAAIGDYRVKHAAPVTPAIPPMPAMPAAMPERSGQAKDIAAQFDISITRSASERILSTTRLISEFAAELPDGDAAVSVRSAVDAIIEACSRPGPAAPTPASGAGSPTTSKRSRKAAPNGRPTKEPNGWVR